MLHEFRDIILSAKIARERNIKTTLVTVVAVEGSSYRRPGVRMAVHEDGRMVGAVSGGCVEKEVARQAQSVFKDGVPKLMVYDGRYRLGCEGILYILIEPFEPKPDFFDAFEAQWKIRKPFEISSYFFKEASNVPSGGSYVTFSDETTYEISKNSAIDKALEHFQQTIKPGFKLYIVGAEHDAVQLCQYASLTGWEVVIVAPPDDPKTIDNFPGASAYLGIDEHAFGKERLDEQTAVLLMTHSFVKDLKYLSEMIDKKFAYLGLLGPKHRREKMISQLLEYHPDISYAFLERIHGPCGIDIGAETPQEIAISILAEILSIVREKEPISLKDKAGGIHQ
ncbi:XdhC family protein [Sungkyunkwania multivorans]|uniref:XdhC family protein n=1 Tax=Sungkyunkwania multivorans TaxID=1173618 RepID=A0ABW3D0H0_9FLAO